MSVLRTYCLGALLALSFGATASAQSVIYDNTTTFLEENFPLLPAWENNSAEVGDEIWLGGTDRQVTNFKLIFYYRGTTPGTFDAVVRFRNYDSNLVSPTNAFYETPLTTVVTTAGLHELNFEIPNVIVPDRFVWTIQAFNRQGSNDELGMAYYNPPTVGHSEDFLWQRGDNNDWTAYSWGADPYANFGAQLTAVPEPGTLAVIGAGLLIARRRRPKQ